MLHLHEAPPFNVILLLLDKGADVNAATQNGERPPHYAFKGWHDKIIQLLLDHGANVVE
jgi:ankyrin repeat protein